VRLHSAPRRREAHGQRGLRGGGGGGVGAEGGGGGGGGGEVCDYP